MTHVNRVKRSSRLGCFTDVNSLTIATSGNFRVVEKEDKSSFETVRNVCFGSNTKV